MRNALIITLILSMAAWCYAAGREGVVKTRGGLTYAGLVDENEKGATINMRGIDITVPRENIASIAYGDFADRWKADYAKLAKTDTAGRIAAGRKAMENREPDLADKAFRDALAIDPNNAAAADLLNANSSQRRLVHGQSSANGDHPDQDSSAPGPTPTTRPLGIYATLTPQQINRVKQLESRETDLLTRFAFDNNVRKKFFDDNPQVRTQTPTYGDFSRQANGVIAMQIIKSGSDLAKDVRITNDPDTIQAFRQDVLPLVLQGCATSGCHGGNNAASKKFALISPTPDSAAMYTDFYVLESTSVKRPVSTSNTPNASIVGNTIMPDTAMMFDRARPEGSLVLQYGLPDLQSQTKHPYVRGYNGIFRSVDDARYQTVLNFIKSLNPVAPEYGFTFKLERNAPPEAKPVPTTLPANAP